jgi:hypothetical protein
MTKLTAERRKDLARLAELPDGGVDLSDIPEIKSLSEEINTYLRQLMQRNARNRRRYFSSLTGTSKCAVLTTPLR